MSVKTTWQPFPKAGLGNQVTDGLAVHRRLCLSRTLAQRRQQRVAEGHLQQRMEEAASGTTPTCGMRRCQAQHHAHAFPGAQATNLPKQVHSAGEQPCNVAIIQAAVLQQRNCENLCHTTTSV